MSMLVCRALGLAGDHTCVRIRRSPLTFYVRGSRDPAGELRPAGLEQREEQVALELQRQWRTGQRERGVVWAAAWACARCGCER